MDKPFVSDVGERETFDADEIQPRRVRDGHGFGIGPGQHLNAARQSAYILYRAGNDRHHGNNFRADCAAQVRCVVHVLQHDRVHTRLAVHLRFAHRRGFNLAHATPASGRAGQRVQMDHGDNGFGRREQRVLGRHGEFITELCT